METMAEQRVRERDAVVKVLTAILEVIKEAGPHGIPEGHLYAALMGYISLETFQSVVNFLIATRRVKRSGYVLTAS